MHHHVLAWRHHEVRPTSNAADPARTDSRYCFYDRAHNDYLYSSAWVAKLEAELEDGEEAVRRWNRGRRARAGDDAQR